MSGCGCPSARSVCCPDVLEITIPADCLVVPQCAVDVVEVGYVEGSGSDPGGCCLTGAMPTASAPGNTGVVGVAADAARADHRHAREAFGPAVGPPAFGDAPSNGTAGTVPRSDHTHGLPDITAADIPPEFLTEAEGDARYAPIGGGGVTYGPVVGPPAFGTPSADGVLTSVSRSDHVHGNPAITVADVPNLPASKITSGQFATAQIPDLDAAKITSGRFPMDRLPVDVLTIPLGDARYETPAGAQDKVDDGIAAHDAAADPHAQYLTQAEGDARYGQLTTATPAASAPGDTGAVGVATTAARADHRHAREAFGPSVGPAAFGSAKTDGTAATLARADHTHGNPAITAADVPNLDASKITTGTLAIARIPVGTTAGTVAAGDDARITGAQQRSALTAKGDLYAATASATTTRVAVGTDGQVLIADSTQATGVRWGAAGGSVSYGPVVGPPAYGDPAVDGVLTTVSRSDHEHGLPAITAADVPNLDASKITTGAFDAARIPNLDASKITTGTIPVARLDPTVLTESEAAALYAPQTFPLSAYGILAASGDPLTFMGATTPLVSAEYVTRMWIPAGVAITNVHIAVRGAGVHDGATGTNRIGIYSDAGALQGAIPDTPTLWTVAGWRGGAITGGPIAAQGTGRFVYVGFLCRGMTTLPTISYPAASGATTGWFHQTVTGTAMRRAMFGAATDLLASFDPATFGTTSTLVPLIAIS